MKNKKIFLPCLRGHMGDWHYYATIMKFSDIAERTSMVPDIHRSKELSRWIQRKVGNRSKDIVTYIENQEQRFFNSIIFGIYGGEPSWQEIDVEGTNDFSETDLNYLNKTFGILTLSGSEEIFAIDGQHRTKAIKEIQKKTNDYGDEEISVIFISHKKTKQGEVRTRRLFSTLNRYAKPVNISEIIALDEEDNCAILTRELIENFDLFKGKIAFSKARGINPSNSKSFTNIVLLYDIVSILLTNRSLLVKYGKISGYDRDLYEKRRDTEENLKDDLKKLQTIFKEVIKTVPSLSAFFSTGYVDRTQGSTSLLFRPIGQLIFFTVYKIAIDRGRKKDVLAFFKKDNFNLNSKVWRRVFVNEESGTLKTDTDHKRYAAQLILKHLDIDFSFSTKERENYKNFNIPPDSI
jgi:DNA sulfur modification protein DndB